jgi:uncharacterized protein (TIGR00251 family)
MEKRANRLLWFAASGMWRGIALKEESMTPGDVPCLEATRALADRLLVTCHVTPRARRERIACEGGKLRVWLHAPPVDGAANEALIALFARTLKLPKRAITLERGATARQKTLAIEGMSVEAFWRRIDATTSD